MAQETYKIPELQWWGLPVGITFIAAGIAATMYVNQGIESFTTGVIGAIALLVLCAGIMSFGTFVYSIIAKGVSRSEAKRFIPESTH